MYEEYAEEDLDLSDYEVVEDEEGLDSDEEKYCTGCTRGCMDCLGFSWKDFT